MIRGLLFSEAAIPERQALVFLDNLRRVECDWRQPPKRPAIQGSASYVSVVIDKAAKPSPPYLRRTATEVSGSLLCEGWHELAYSLVD